MILAIGHVKGQGKDTFAKLIQQQVPGSVILHFADPLYETCYSLFAQYGFKDMWFYLQHPEEKEVPLEIGLTPRQILLSVGEKMREVHATVWADKLIDRASNHEFVIVPDLRHINEVEAVQKAEGYLIKIVRPGEVVMQEVDIDRNLRDFKDWDYVINNDGSLADLEMKAKLFLEDFWGD